ncbi:hypothetical protein C1631_008180 [Chryseobacterium phosphatilyticum]|uniref:Uncharacterized protein n=1 Tax=Chryseobacterium phosphatilyticum TaxID=475075 RepID=A0A316XGR2_9FLAO|nr:hypothetical protein C1631_008180 [Chryseobacterium phosphatilyticum]
MGKPLCLLANKGFLLCISLFMACLLQPINPVIQKTYIFHIYYIAFLQWRFFMSFRWKFTWKMKFGYLKHKLYINT